MTTHRASNPARGAALAALCWIAGCTTLGPDYEEPQVDWLDGWETDLYGQTATPQAQAVEDLSFWWHLFDDPVLNDLMVTARRENLSLQIAGLRILESRAVLGIADSSRYPQLQQVTGGIAYVNSQEQGSSGSDESLAAYQGNFNLGWELDFWGRFRRGIESADAAFFSAISTHQDIQVLLAAQVADLYYAYLTTQLRIQIARNNAEIQARSLEITQQLYAGGQNSELDVAQARTQYLTTLSTIPDLEITLTQVRNALAAVLGRPPGELSELGDMPENLPSTEPVQLDGIPAELLTRRPDIRAAAWQVAAQSAQIGVARADYYPAISLVGTLGWSGNNLNDAPDVGTLGIGPAFTWNVFDYGRIRNNIRVQDARLEQLVGNFQNQVLQAAREIDDAAISVYKTYERQSILADSVDSAERALDIANTRYREGYSDFQRVLDAQRSLFSANERELVNQGGHVSAVIAFYKAVGGGWLDMPIEEMIPEDTRDLMKARSNWGELLDQPLPYVNVNQGMR
jgi:NodT family efflux transporter outer membrane factor (OMF) lipoprotein